MSPPLRHPPSAPRDRLSCRSNERISAAAGAIIVYYARRQQNHTDKTPKTQNYTTVHTGKNDKNTTKTSICCRYADRVKRAGYFFHFQFVTVRGKQQSAAGLWRAQRVTLAAMTEVRIPLHQLRRCRRQCRRFSPLSGEISRGVRHD